MDSLIQALRHFFSEYVVALAVVIVAAVWAIWKLASAFQSMSDKVMKVDGLPCSEHQKLIHRASEDMREIKGMLAILTESVDFPSGKVYRKSERVYSRKHSPRALNEAGESLYARSGGKAFVEANLDALLAAIDRLKPLTALDVEADSVIALRQLSGTPRMNAVKDWIYNAPMEKITDVDGTVADYEITLGDVLFVCSIPLRDKYLALHPEILPQNS